MPKTKVLEKFVRFAKKRILEGTAIYIGDDFIDVAKAKLGPAGAEVIYLQRFPILENIKGLSYAEARENIDGVLDKTLESEEDKPYRVAVNLKNDYFILRRFEFKEVPEAELRKVILFEAQKYVPYPMEDLTFSFRKRAKKDGLLEIIFVAAETKNINNLISYFKEKNIISSVIEPTPVLIARALGLEGKLKKNKAYLSIHYEPANKVIVTGIWHGLPHFFREIEIFSGEEGFKTTELGYPTLKDVWNVIGNDILGAEEYLKKDTKSDVEKVFISGFSPFPDEDNISGEFGIPFERLRISYIKDAPAENADRYLATLSLLYETLHTPFLNLAQREITEKDLWTYKPVVVKAVFILCAVLFLHFGLSAANIAHGKKIKETMKSFEASKAIRPEASSEEVLKYKEALEEKTKFINNAVTGRIYLTEKLNQLGKEIPPDAWLERIDFQNHIGVELKRSLRIEGAIYAMSEEGVKEISAMLERMRQDKGMMLGFKDIKLVSAKKKMIQDTQITEFEFALQ